MSASQWCLNLNSGTWGKQTGDSTALCAAESPVLSEKEHPDVFRTAESAEILNFVGVFHILLHKMH
ncbi:hypothetical protein GCM10010912_16140 [Paenibacillus albidus]|uniref:Uncharacterized protein n=1 Tax=Paenibacillus albidus TaxID=2041023 RepID=A0A917C7Q3_9BACL|nr:hypothetical protein GCM10010912_16140 [Paenibacillus albidus]